MPASQNSKSKLLGLLEIFYTRTDAKHGIEMTEILNYLEEKGIHAERKSIYKDIEVLKENGFKIEKQKRDNKFYYYLSERAFAPYELKILADSVAASKLITMNQSRQLLKKIEKLGSVYEERELSRSVVVFDRPKTSNDKVTENIGLLSRAIDENKKINFEYLEWNVDKKLQKRTNGDKKQISPCFLELSDGNYYLVALDGENDKCRHYRVDKMSGIVICPEKRSKGVKDRKYRNPALYSRKLSGMFSGEEIRLKLEAPEDKLGIVIDHFGPTAVEIPKVKNENGTYNCYVNVELSDILLGWLFGVSRLIRLAGPEEAVSAYENLLKMNLQDKNGN